MMPSLSGARLSERVHNVVDAIQAANNDGGREVAQGGGFVTNDGQTLTSFLNGLVNEDPRAELFNTVEYGHYINQSPDVPVLPTSSYKYKDPLHKGRSAQRLRDFMLFDVHNGQIDHLASPEDLADATLFSEIRERRFHAECINAGPSENSILDNMVFDIDNETLFGFYIDIPAESIPDETPVEEALQAQEELEQPGQLNSGTQTSEQDNEQQRRSISGTGEPKYLAEEEQEQELANESQSNIDQGDVESDDDVPEELTPQEEREQEYEGCPELNFGQGGCESDDLEPEQPRPSDRAGEWQNRLLSGQIPAFGPDNFLPKPAYTSPYAMAPVHQPKITQTGAVEDPIIVPDSPVLQQRTAVSSSPQYSQNQLPGLIQQLPKSTASPQSSHNPRTSQPAPVLGLLKDPGVLTTSNTVANQAHLLMLVAAAAPIYGTSISPFVAPQSQPAPAIASFATPTQAPGWAAFVAPTLTSAENPAGFAAAHALIARTPFRSQGKNGPYTTHGQDEGEFLVFILNAFVPHYFRKFHPNQSIPTGKRDWFRALPQREQDRCRRYIQQKVEAELPEDVAAEVNRLRRGSPTMAMNGEANSKMSTAMNTGLGGGSNGWGNATWGGAYLAMTATRGMNPQQSNQSWQVADGNAAIDLQNLPGAQMQDAADQGLRFGAGGSVGALQLGRTASHSYRACMEPSSPNVQRNYQERPLPPNHSGYRQETPYQSISSNSTEPALRQQTASSLSGTQTIQSVTNDGVYPHQQVQRPVVMEYSAGGSGDSSGTMYPMPTQNVQSRQLGYHSGYQTQKNSLSQDICGTGRDSSNLPSMHDVATAGIDINGRNYRYINYGPTEMAGAWSASRFPSDWAGLLQTGSTLLRSKRKPHDDEDDDDESINSGARPAKVRRT